MSEPALRMGLGHIYQAILYLERLPEGSAKNKILKDLAETQERIRTYARKQRIDLNESMPT